MQTGISTFLQIYHNKLFIFNNFQAHLKKTRVFLMTKGTCTCRMTTGYMQDMVILLHDCLIFDIILYNTLLPSIVITDCNYCLWPQIMLMLKVILQQ